MFGRDPVGRRHEDWEPTEDPDPDENTRLRRLDLARTYANRFIRAHQEKNKDLYDVKAKPCDVQRGDVVLAKVVRPRGPVRKLTPKYAGPFRVVRRINQVVYLVPIAFPETPERPLHVDRIRICDENRLVQPFREPIDLVWGGMDPVDPNIQLEASSSGTDPEGIARDEP
jgi:hypothetical protein